MNDLSDPSAQPVQNAAPPVSQPPPISGAVSSGNKEAIGGSIMKEEGLQDATGAEFELPKEVSSVGVRIQHTSIPIPESISKMGVQPAGQNVPVQTTSAVKLPLSDDQIARGLHASITESIRWLAEWCVRRLKHVHLALKDVHGKLVRVKEA